jgi:Phytanoyl-CoA dioxygenase (PhyH)
VDELTDSSGLAGDAVKLRQRLADDGYLFFRGLLPADQVLAAGTVVRDRLREGGWTDPDGMPSGQQRAVNPSDALSDPAFRAAVMSAEFNRIPYLPPLRRMVREVLGRTAFSFPVKVLRAVYPEGPGTRPRGRYIHYDYGSGGGQDMLTSWIPLMDIPLPLGGLAVQPGGQYWPPKWPRRPRPLTAAEPGWASTDYRPGDVIVFHCLTPHAALPNTTMANAALPGPMTAAGRASLRLSGDFRWQLPDQPVPTEMVLGPLARQPEGSRPSELFSRLFGNQPWWEPIPPGLVLRPRAELAAIPPAPSRFFAVHPGWQAWQAPPQPSTSGE